VVLFDFGKGSWPDLFFVSLVMDANSRQDLPLLSFRTTSYLSRVFITSIGSLIQDAKNPCLSERKSPGYSQPYASDKAQWSTVNSPLQRTFWHINGGNCEDTSSIAVLGDIVPSSALCPVETTCQMAGPETQSDDTYLGHKNFYRIHSL